MSDEEELAKLAKQIVVCTKCDLHRSRKKAVPGEGPTHAEIMFIGEGPGFHENEQGRPFVGAAGKFLDQLLEQAGVTRADVWITNVVKCRPPGNRDPRPAEAASCRAFLERQVALIDPTLVIAVGRIAAQNLLATETPIAKLRSKVHAFGAKGWPLIVTYHPAYLLRSPAEKRKAWADLLHARQLFTRLEGDRDASRRAS